jgi:outer membrane protein TolC
MAMTQQAARLLQQSSLALLCGLSLTGAARPAEVVILGVAAVPPSAKATDVIQLVGTTEPKSPPPPAANSPFADRGELSVDVLVEQVLAVNPSLAQMVAAWQAASARYPQVTSLEDPMFAGTIGPGTIGPDDPGINFAYRMEISQKYPWPGKLRLRGQNALAEAGAAGNEVDDMRLQLIESARAAFYDYYLVARALEVNEQNLRLLERFRTVAQSRYENKLVPLQDVLQAKVEIGRERQRRLTLERMQEVAVARINTLLNRPPTVPLPPPPQKVTVGDGIPDAESLRSVALSRRPDLLALNNRIAADQASLGLAYKEFCPDLEPFFMYDRFMGNNDQNKDLATMVGLKLNLPIRLARRRAAVAEAQARLNQRRAELARQVNQVNFEVQQAHAQVRESSRTVRIYEQSILPDAQRNVEAAQSAYETGGIAMLNFIGALRDQVMLRDRYYEAVADYFRRRATLERVIGGPLTTSPAPGSGGPVLPSGVPCGPGPAPARRLPG